MPVATSSADGVAWDLNDLYHGVEDPQLTGDLETALQLLHEEVTAPGAAERSRSFFDRLPCPVRYRTSSSSTKSNRWNQVFNVSSLFHFSPSFWRMTAVLYATGQTYNPN